MCHRERIPVNSSLNKYELVQIIAEKQGERTPQLALLYSGNLRVVPTSTTAIGKLPVCKLRAILHYHGFPIFGTKDELVLRVFMLKHNTVDAMLAKETKQLKELIKIIQELILREKEGTLQHHVYRQRTYTNPQRESPKLDLPIKPPDLLHMFDPLVQYVDIVASTQKHRGTSLLIQSKTDEQDPLLLTSDQNQQAELMVQTGARVRVKWTKEELGNSGWKPRWYTAEVQAFDPDTDVLTVTYLSEPGCVYDIELSNYVTQNKIVLVRAVV